MANPRQTFKSRRCQEVLEQLVDALVARGGASTWDLALITGLNTNTVGAYLNHMQRIGTAHCAEPARKVRSGSTYAQWAPGKAAVDTDDTVEDMPRRVVVRKEWELNLKRDSMHCYLFGEPGARAAA